MDRDGWMLTVLVPDAPAILRGGNLVVTEQGIRYGVRQMILPLWNVYHFGLYTNAARGQRLPRPAADEVRRDGPRHPGETGAWSWSTKWLFDEYDIWAAAERPRAYTWTRSPTGTCAGPASASGGHRGVRRALHTCPRDRVPRGRPAAAARHRGDLARAHRRCSAHLTDWPDASPPPAP
ncbi:hypothetical protein QJS66_01655 [Kocuria rhizophila]|nr:hypothetical protein QJS66_01655 [Kocuria rhizophila]